MRILLVEDDKNLLETLSFQLTHAGFIVDTCENGEDALYYITENIHDLILLDRMLPIIDGITVLQKLRASGNQIPVILLTALGELSDKITGLDSGADDYLVKPFAFEELLARIRSISRRPRQWMPTETLTFGDLTFDPAANRLSGAAGSCTLSKKEGALLKIFLQNPAQTLPRATLLSKVWGFDSEVEEGNLDNYMHFIRRRLKSASSSVSIKTVRGIGYRLEDTSHV
ncbi:MAG: response regulator transcription factor [Eubacterium sp.]|jgi:DNA-binding response OmpR family regulator|nr:response regulator transcription factor [Eubacterium sp.]NBI86557.1 DNA-binding response regulator [Lachnospiraceae bacterium]